MKIKFFTLLYSLLILSFVGCAPFSKKVTLNDHTYLNSESINKLNGTYEINASKIIYKSSRDNKTKIFENDSVDKYYNLFHFVKTENQELRADSIKNLIKKYDVRIEVLDKKKISFSLLKDNLKVDSSIVNYKIKNDGYIYLKNKNFKSNWIPILCGNFSINRTRLSLNNENSLILNNSNYFHGAILVIIGDSRSFKFEGRYNRKK